MLCVKIAKVKNIKESEYKYQIIECYWSLWIKIKSIRVKNLNNMLKKKCNICLENGRTQSNMCLKSVREIIFKIDINDSIVAFFMFWFRWYGAAVDWPDILPFYWIHRDVFYHLISSMQTLLHKKWQTDILPGIKKTRLLSTFGRINFW